MVGMHWFIVNHNQTQLINYGSAQYKQLPNESYKSNKCTIAELCIRFGIVP